MKLSDIAQVIRSKNAGPRRLTLDVMFATDADYQRVAQSPALGAEAIGRLYGVPAEAVTVIPYPAGRAIKIVWRAASWRAIPVTSMFTARSSTRRCWGSRYERLRPHPGRSAAPAADAFAGGVGSAWLRHSDAGVQRRPGARSPI